MNDTINLRHLSTREFTALGVQDLAYVKAVVAGGRTAFAMHAADGTELGVVASLDLAFAALRQHDLEPMSVH
jgi:hypothetical protein